jgi:hypothetical protein
MKMHVSFTKQHKSRQSDYLMLLVLHGFAGSREKNKNLMQNIYK